MARPPIPADVRLACYRRDAWRCRYCGTELAASQATLDHIIPLSRGGASIDRRNLVMSCAPCNQRKGDRTPYEARMAMIPDNAGRCPPGWREGQTSHPRRVHARVVYAERPQYVPMVDPVLWTPPPPKPCNYCTGHDGAHEQSCPIRRPLVARTSSRPQSREDHRKMMRARRKSR